VSANQIVYMVNNGGQYDIYIADITNMAGATNLTGTSAENEKFPAWGDGKIIYIKQDGTSGVYTMNFDGSGKTRLNENYRYAANPRWVP
jgi:Tol biopolymer transport system component